MITPYQDEHAQGIADENSGTPWPENPSGPYRLARLRRAEARKIDRSIQHILWFLDQPWNRVS